MTQTEVRDEGKENIYDTAKCRLLRKYELSEHDKLFLFRFEDPDIAMNWRFKTLPACVYSKLPDSIN